MASQETRQKSSIRRNQYKELLDLGSEIESTAENESAIHTLKRITDVAKRSDDLNAQGRFQDRVENTTEVVMDAQVMKMTHELLGSMVQKMDNTEISDDEFVAAINRTIGVNMDWDKLAEISMKMSKTLTYSQPLFGTFDEETVIPQKEVKERRKNTTIKNTQQVKPIAVIQQKKKEEQEAEAVNVVINQIIELYKSNNDEPLPYYQLIIDPGNFMRTIHNAFQVSFLLRDGAVVIEEDQFGNPTVRPMQKNDKGNFEERNHQMVSNLTTKLCDEMIERYHITEALISWPDTDE